MSAVSRGTRSWFPGRVGVVRRHQSHTQVTDRHSGHGRSGGFSGSTDDDGGAGGPVGDRRPVQPLCDCARRQQVRPTPSGVHEQPHVSYADAGMEGDYATVSEWLAKQRRHQRVWLHLVGNRRVSLDGDRAQMVSTFFLPRSATRATPTSPEASTTTNSFAPRMAGVSPIGSSATSGTSETYRPSPQPEATHRRTCQRPSFGCTGGGQSRVNRASCWPSSGCVTLG